MYFSLFIFGKTFTFNANPPQLESIVRISEALAKMRLAAFTTDNDVEESLRLFQVRLDVLSIPCICDDKLNMF